MTVILHNPENYECAVEYLPFVSEDKPIRKTACNRLHSAVRRKLKCENSLWRVVTRYVPILDWLPKYNFKKDMLPDLVAGLTVGTLAIPQGLGYAIVAGVSPISGLYTSFIPGLIYTALGTSRHVSVGTFALVSLMTGKSVSDVVARQIAYLGNSTGNNTESFLVSPEKVASTLAFAVGIWQVLLGLLGLGSLTVYLSDRVVKGFACGASFHIFATQLKWIFGLPLPKRRGWFNLLYTIWDLGTLMTQAHLPTCIVTLLCIVALIAARILNSSKKIISVIRFPIPMELIVIVFATLASYLMDMRVVYGVDTVRHIPRNLPEPVMPEFSLILEILGDSFMIGLIAFSTAVSAGRLFGQKHGYEIHPNQELRALGIANIVPSFFQCFPSSVALARSVVQEAVGGATQVVSLITAVLVILIITVMAPFLDPVPKPCLGSIIVFALGPMLMRVTDACRLWKIDRIEALIYAVPIVFIVVLDVEVGLLIGVVFSLFAVILRQQTPKMQLLGQVEKGEKGSVTQIRLLPGVKIIRITAPLYFANTEISLKKVRKLAFSNQPLDDTNSTLMETDLEADRQQNDESGEVQEMEITSLATDTNSNAKREKVPFLSPVVAAVVLDMVAVEFVDITGAEALKSFSKECLHLGYRLYFASTSNHVKNMMLTCGTSTEFTAQMFFDSVSAAVKVARKQADISITET